MQRLASADRGIQLRGEPQVAAATVPAAYLDDDGATAPPAKSIVRRQEDPRNRRAECGAAFLEREREPLRQSSCVGELTIDGSEVRQGADGSLHCHRYATLASGSSLRSAAATASKIAAASGAARMAFTASSYANI